MQGKVVLPVKFESEQDKSFAKALIVSMFVIQTISMAFPFTIGITEPKASAHVSVAIQFYIVNPLIISAFCTIYLYQKKHLRFLDDMLRKELKSERQQAQFDELKKAGIQVLLFFIYIL